MQVRWSLPEQQCCPHQGTWLVGCVSDMPYMLLLMVYVRNVVYMCIGVVHALSSPAASSDHYRLASEGHVCRLMKRCLSKFALEAQQFQKAPSSICKNYRSWCNSNSLQQTETAERIHGVSMEQVWNFCSLLYVHLLLASGRSLCYATTHIVTLRIQCLVDQRHMFDRLLIAAPTHLVDACLKADLGLP